ncbi:MAG: replication-relaxation family protein, partial [Acidimicrobiales bacterium]
SESWHYVLGPIGATLAAARREVDAPPPSKLRVRTMRLAVRPQLDHLLGLNGWFCDLAAEARRRPDARLSRWWSERRCAERFGTIVHPDAFATYVEGDRRADFYFEFDAGTEALGRVAGKVARYADLLEAGGPKAPVLIWCASSVRERHLIAAIKKERAANLPACVVATGSAEARILLGSELCGASWLVPGEEGRRTLFDLASAARGSNSEGAIDEAADAASWEE